MADFRKLIYALALVAMLAGLSMQASAQTTPFVCNNVGSVVPIVRAEGYTEQVGDVVFQCTGGIPTPIGAPVPQVNFQIGMNTGVTSKLLSNTPGSTTQWSEALLIIDEPHSATNYARPILNCGAGVASDTGVSGPGVCAINSVGNPSGTYDGCPATPTAPGTGDSGTPAVPVCATTAAYGAGRPNVFQAKWAATLPNGLSWNGVPLDPPGTTTTRTLRFTNIRVDAEGLPFSPGSVLNVAVTASISVNGSTVVSFPVPTVTVGFVQQGLLFSGPLVPSSFLQCNSQNNFGPNSPAATGTGQGPLGTNSFGVPVNALVGQASTVPAPTFTFSEGFASSWKTKNISYVINTSPGGSGNGTLPGGGAYWAYNGTYNTPTDVNQNVPGAIYNTESGFENGATGLDPNPSPPSGTGTGNVTIGLGNAFTSTSTGIAGAGVATAGTRLAIAVTNIPAGAIVLVPEAIPLKNSTGKQTGVAVLTTTDSAGAGIISIPATPSTGSYLTTYGTLQSNGLAVYEVLWADPFSIESAQVAMAVAYTYNATTSQPTTGGPAAQAFGSFAPFYTPTGHNLGPAAASSTAPIPRFSPTQTGQAAKNIFTISKCSCNILLPWAVSAGGFDTGIAIANTSKDDLGGPGISLASPQTGPIQLWFYGVGSGTSGAPPATQCTNASSPGTCPGTTNVPAGMVAAWPLSTGSTQWGLQAVQGFYGYIIAQASFQYCHAFAYISAIGAGPTSTGISEGYLGILLDQGSQLQRTMNPVESLNN